VNYAPNFGRPPRLDRDAARICKDAARICKDAERIPDPVERLRYLRSAAVASRARRGAMTLAWLAVPLLIGIVPFRVHSRPAPVPAPPVPSGGRTPLDSTPSEPPKVWRVESTESAELYSNGLRIDLTFAAPNHPRPTFSVYSLANASQIVGEASQPLGIVYHTSESDLAPFEERSNRQLKRIGRGLLELVRQEHCYHYVIDRFGRVFRVVPETDVAFHAGYSVWADNQGVYVNLNDSFLAVSFEGQTGALEEVAPAQISSARALTEMLRSRYGISAANCVTHAQVSVNPDNLRIGSHTDWAGKFPFREIGLPDNYQATAASVSYFGFLYDSVFLHATGGAWKTALDRAEDQLRRRAEAEGIGTARYRAALQRRYKQVLATLKERTVAARASHEQGATP
jgi:hypothetical protein